MKLTKLTKSVVGIVSLATSFGVVANETMRIDNPEPYIHDVWLRDNDRLAHFTDKTFYPSNVLRIKSNDGMLTLINDAPLEFNNMRYVATLKNGMIVDVLELANLPAIAELKVKHPIYRDINEFRLHGTDEFVSLKISDFEGAVYDYDPQDQDQLNARPNKSTLSFKFNSRLFDGEKFRLTSNVVWRPETPNAMRYLLGAMINWSKVVGSQEFEDAWMETPFLSSDPNRIKDSWKWSQAVDYVQLSENGKRHYNEAFQKYGYEHFYSNGLKKNRLNTLRSRYYNLGETGGGGLGGGATLGVSSTGFTNGHTKFDPIALDKYRNKDWTGVSNDKRPNGNAKLQYGMYIFAHEAGHTIGGSHKDNFCSNIAAWGINPVTTNVIAGFIADEKMLITDKNMMERSPLWETRRKDKKVGAAPAWNNRWQPIEWGNTWGHHNIELPFPTKTMDEDSNYLELFREYIQAHNEGWGLEYLKSLPFNADVKYHKDGAPVTELTKFQAQGKHAQFYHEYADARVSLPMNEFFSFHMGDEKAGDGLVAIARTTEGELYSQSVILDEDMRDNLVLAARSLIDSLGLDHAIELGERLESGQVIWNENDVFLNNITYNTNHIDDIRIELISNEINVALNKPVTAYKVPNNSSKARAYHANDGDPSTRFVSPVREMSINFEGERDVTRIILIGGDRNRYKKRMNGTFVSLLDADMNILWKSEELHKSDSMRYEFEFDTPILNVHHVKFEATKDNIEFNELEVYAK
ncbi:exported hypothetical protein [Vibrio harveyi]|uniref:hypothetical protein n=1 Tax=Vibrio harveyi TaxID=669 RepID=UPI002AD7D115|nr:hypothetical protein [Vibrio harveyi]CAK6714375.1 exported hypothetical protein [Vibrio harveyi]